MAQRKRRKEKVIYKKNTPVKSYKSLLYGAITVVILFVILALGIRNFVERRPGDIAQDGVSISKEEKILVTPEQGTTPRSSDFYTVQSGDTLWSIAERFYKDGFAWKTIAQANNVVTPSMLEKGTKIVIPPISPMPTTVAQPSTPDPPATEITNKITGDSYTVQKGDDLWNIAVRAYGDGFKWVEIARVNKLAKPDIIHAENILKLPRQG